MSNDIVIEDIFDPIPCSERNSSEKTNEINNPYSFKSFLDNKGDKDLSFDKIDLFSVASNCDNASVKFPNIGIQSIAPKNDATIQSNSTQPKIYNEIQDNPFSFKHFLQSEQHQSNSDLLVENSSFEQNTPFPELLNLRNENSELTKENLSLLMKLQYLEKENSSLILKLDNLQRKDSEESKALNAVICNVEHNLDRATRRALTAEKRLDNLNAELFKLKMEMNSKIREFYSEQTQSIGSKIRIASTEAEYMLNQMLTGVGNLRQISDILESLPRLYDPIDSKNIV